MRIRLQHGDRHLSLEVQRDGDAYRVRNEASEHIVRATSLDPVNVLIDIDGVCHRVAFVRRNDVFLLAIGGETYSLTRVHVGGGGAETTPIAAPEIVAPMPGKVIQVLITPGDTITRGDPLLILEAMKMENRILAEASGVVETVEVHAGDLVDGGQVLAVIKYDLENKAD